MKKLIEEIKNTCKEILIEDGLLMGAIHLTMMGAYIIIFSPFVLIIGGLSEINDCTKEWFKKRWDNDGKQE